MISVQLRIARFCMPAVRNVSRFVSAQPQQILQKYSCISSSLPLKLSPIIKCFSMSSFHHQNTTEPFKSKPLAKKKSERKRRTIIEDEQQASSNPV